MISVDPRQSEDVWCRRFAAEESFCRQRYVTFWLPIFVPRQLPRQAGAEDITKEPGIAVVRAGEGIDGNVVNCAAEAGATDG